MEEENTQEKTENKTMTMRELDDMLVEHEIKSILRKDEAKRRDFTIGGFVTACIVSAVVFGLSSLSSPVTGLLAMLLGLAGNMGYMFYKKSENGLEKVLTSSEAFGAFLGAPISLLPGLLVEAIIK